MAYINKDNLYEGYIYKITNNINGKIYIGLTTNTIERRFQQHCLNPFKTSVIDNAIKKYGKENFIVEEVDKCQNKDLKELRKELGILERKYINLYKSSVKLGGYNITDGGQNDPCTKSVDKYDFNGNLLDTYCSISDALRKNNISDKKSNNISKVCSGKRISAYGFIWRYHNEPFDKYPTANKTRHKITPIDVYDSYGNKIAEYNDVYDIPIYGEDAYTRGMILNVCLGNERSLYGLVYRYKGDAFNKYGEYLIQRKSYPINCYTKDNIYIQTFPKAVDAGKYIDINNYQKKTRCITAVCRKEKKSAYGFLWYYSDDPNQPDKSKIIIAEEFRKQQLQAEQQTA